MDYSNEQLDWDTVNSIIDNNELHRLIRHPDEQQSYIQCINEIKNKYNSVGDCIFDTVFKYPTVLNDNGKLSCINITDKQIIFTQNDYRYNFEPNILHYILWSTNELNENEIIYELENRIPYIINKPFVKRNRDYNFWINPLNIQSVKTIWHAQVIIKN
jgi:hypothetical protein